MSTRPFRSSKLIPPQAAASVAVHGVIFSLLLFAPGIASPGAAANQTSVIRAVSAPESLPETEEVGIPLFECGEPMQPPEPLARELPVEDPPLFERTPVPVTRLDTAPPTLLTPSVRPRPPAIAVEPRPTAPRAARPAPRTLPEPPAPRNTFTQPVAERRPSPEYPRRAAERGIEGRVVLTVEVLPDGSVGDVTVKASSGHALLDEAAVRAVRKWHFRPARVNGRPARSLVRVPFRFDS